MALESKLGSRIVLGCSIALAGRGATWAKENFFRRLRSHHMYGRQLFTLGNEVGPRAGRGGESSPGTKETPPGLVWDVMDNVPLMLLLNGLLLDDTSTLLKDMVTPKIAKGYWLVVVNTSRAGYRILDFHALVHILSPCHDEQEALAEWDVPVGLLHRCVKPNSVVISSTPTEPSLSRH